MISNKRNDNLSDISIRTIHLEYFILIILLISTLSCKGGTTDEPISVGELKLDSSIPIDGAVNVSTDLKSLTLVFEDNIKIISKTGIKLNDTELSNISANLKELRIQVNLERGKIYTLIVPEKSVEGRSKGVLNQKIEITFSTSEKNNLNVPNPTPEALKLYGFLNETYGNKTISGTMANVNWNIEEAQWVFEQTGKYPALNCFDYVHHHYSPANWIDYSNTSIVEDWWKNNGIISIMWHWNVPKDMQTNTTEYAFYTSDTNFDLSKINNTNSPEYKLLIKDIDIISGYLKLLKDKNIPVLWRPLHEASGNANAFPGGTAWFWWGAKGPEPCKTLWKLMFDRMTNHHRLNNLIWIWTTQGNDAEWYPGDDFVDIIGRDLYPETNVHASQITEFNKVKEILGNNKMITLSECGGIPEPDLMFQKGDTWLWFMPWYGKHTRDNSQNGSEYWKKVMSNAKVITRDRMPSLK